MKKCLAILLSAVIMIGLLPCSVFAESAPEELICEGYFDQVKTYKYCGVLSLGENNSFEVEDDTPYYFTFVPEQTGVYCFYANLKGITADTDDDRCSVTEFEDLLTLHPEDNPARSDYSYLTAGTPYYVLVDYFDGIEISFDGTVTDVEPTIPLVDLVKDWDVFDVEAGFYDGRALDVELVITLSNEKTLYGQGFYFDPGEFTEDSVTWKHLGFEKILRYNTINIKDLVSSVEARNSVDFVRYFDGRIEFVEPVTLDVLFSDGTSTEVVIEDYDCYYSFTASNGRSYTIYLDPNENDELAAWIVNTAFGSIDYTMKRVGFFKDLQYFFLQCKSTVSFWFGMMKHAADFRTKIQILLDCVKELGELRINYLKSMF